MAFTGSTAPSDFRWATDNFAEDFGLYACHFHGRLIALGPIRISPVQLLNLARIPYPLHREVLRRCSKFFTPSLAFAHGHRARLLLDPAFG